MVAFRGDSEKRVRDEIAHVESLLAENLKWLSRTNDRRVRANCESYVKKHTARLRELRSILGVATPQIHIIILPVRE